MEYETSARTPMAAEEIWERVVNVEDWPTFISTYRSVRRLEPGPLELGSRARVVQVGLRPGEWQVTDFDPGRSFTWRSRQPGVLVEAHHRVEPDGTGGCRLTLGIEISGVLGAAVGALLRAKTRRYVNVELAAFTAGNGPTSTTR